MSKYIPPSQRKQVVHTHNKQINYASITAFPSLNSQLEEIQSKKKNSIKEQVGKIDITQKPTLNVESYIEESEEIEEIEEIEDIEEIELDNDMPKVGWVVYTMHPKNGLTISTNPSSNTSALSNNDFNKTSIIQINKIISRFNNRVHECIDIYNGGHTTLLYNLIRHTYKIDLNAQVLDTN